LADRPSRSHQERTGRRDRRHLKVLRAPGQPLKPAEAKQLLAGVQEVIVAESTITRRTLFGSPRLPSPRWHHCPCRPQQRNTFSPLAGDPARADHAGAALPRDEVRRPDLLRSPDNDQRPRPEDGSRRGDRASWSG